MKKISLLAMVASGVVPHLAFAVLTPEQRANPSTGRIPNPTVQEYYLGTVTTGTQQDGFIAGAVYPQQASLSWYKFTSDGVNGIIFDLFGSDFSFSFGGFGGGPDGELAVYNSNGLYIAGTEGVQRPSDGDSNVPVDQPPGSTPLPTRLDLRQPQDPRSPAIEWDGAWYSRNSNNLSQLSFVQNPQPNPLWDPQHPEHNPTAVWDEFDILPAGEYFLAVTGYSTYFAGNPRDNASVDQYGASYPNADGPVTSTTPFGFVTFHANTGVYQLNVRKPGDLDLDGDADVDDLVLCLNKIASFASTDGIPNAGFLNGNPNGDWVGLPANQFDLANELARFDLTGNSRIDEFDLAAFARVAGMTLWDVDNSGLWAETNNWSAYVPDAVDALANFLGVIQSNATITLNSGVTVGAMVFDNANTYTITGSGSISVDVSTDQGAIHVVTGKHVIDVPLHIVDSTNLSVAASSVLTVNQPLSIAAGQTLTKHGPGLLVTGTLSLDPTARLDMTDSAMVVEYAGSSPLSSTILPLLVSGRANGAWNGNGINSSSAAGNPLRAVGYKDTSVTGAQSFHGESIDGSAILIAYTVMGDATLDGTVDSLDFNAFSGGYGILVNGHWFQGDFDYDGKITTRDFNYLAGNFGMSIPAPTLGAVVPEPVGMAALLMGIGLIGRPRKI